MFRPPFLIHPLSGSSCAGGACYQTPCTEYEGVNSANVLSGLPLVERVAMHSDRFEPFAHSSGIDDGVRRISFLPGRKRALRKLWMIRQHRLAAGYAMSRSRRSHGRSGDNGLSVLHLLQTGNSITFRHRQQYVLVDGVSQIRHMRNNDFTFIFETFGIKPPSLTLVVRLRNFFPETRQECTAKSRSNVRWARVCSCRCIFRS